MDRWTDNFYEEITRENLTSPDLNYYFYIFIIVLQYTHNNGLDFFVLSLKGVNIRAPKSKMRMQM